MSEATLKPALTDSLLQRLRDALPPRTVCALAVLVSLLIPVLLLRSMAMEGLVRRLRQMADFVLIDTPCAAAFADAFNVAPLVDGVFMVLRSRHQPTGIEMKIKQMFEEAGVKVFGSILNDVPMNSVESCRYYSEYYASGSRGSRKTEAPALPAGRS